MSVCHVCLSSLSVSYVCLSVCLSVRYVCLSSLSVSYVCLSVCQVCLSVQSVRYVCLSVRYVCLSVMSVCLSVCLSVRYVCLSVCLSGMSVQSVSCTGYVWCAQLRFTMKSYSFIRENAYKVLHPWNKDDNSGNPLWLKAQCLTQCKCTSYSCTCRSCTVVCWSDGASGRLLLAVSLLSLCPDCPLQRQLP